jgi:hypothetical protein
MREKRGLKRDAGRSSALRLAAVIGSRNVLETLPCANWSIIGKAALVEKPLAKFHAYVHRPAIKGQGVQT